jgi:tetratricopeptide (TPR) repeat protein
MRKQTRQKRRPSSSEQAAAHSEPVARGAASAFSAAGAQSQPKPLPRVGWLLIILLAVTAVAIPVWRWYGIAGKSFNKEFAVQFESLQQDRLESLPTQASYPSVEELRGEAQRLTETLLERYPSSASALHLAANQAAQLRQSRQATEYWQRAGELAPQFSGPLAGLAMVQMEQGNNEQAVEILQGAFDAGFRTAELYQLLCQALQRAGDFDRAEEACRLGLEHFPMEAGLWLDHGQLLFQFQRLQEAKTSLERVLQLEPESTAAHFALAAVAARLGETTEAQQYEARYEYLKNQDPLANVRFQAIYRAVLQHILATSLVGAAQEYQLHGDFAAAEEALLRALTLHPQDADACRSLVNLYRRQGRIGDAHLVQQRLVHTQPTVDNLLNLASLAFPLDRYQESEAALQAALQLDSQSPLVYHSLALLYLRTGQIDLAGSYAEQLARLRPDADTFELLSQIYLQTGEQAKFQSASDNARRLRSGR